MTRIAQIKRGETVFVSAAAGAVGSVACQIALALGCTVIASTGGATKVSYLRSMGIHQVVDYQETNNLTASLAQAAPQGIDVYFDNARRDRRCAKSYCSLSIRRVRSSRAFN